MFIGPASRLATIHSSVHLLHIIRSSVPPLPGTGPGAQTRAMTALDLPSQRAEWAEAPLAGADGHTEAKGPSPHTAQEGFVKTAPQFGQPLQCSGRGATDPALGRTLGPVHSLLCHCGQRTFSLWGPHLLIYGAGVKCFGRGLGAQRGFLS